MLIRISLIVAILAGLAVGTLNFIQVKTKIVTLQDNLKSQTDRADTAERARDKNKKDLDATTKTLDQTKQALTAANAEKDKAVSDMAAATKRADQLNDELARNKTELGNVQANLQRFTVIGLTPEQILALNQQVKDGKTALAEAQLVIAGLQKKNASLTNQLAKFIDSERIVYLPASLQGKVIVSDPKYNFVVVDFGDDQGAKQDGELLVSRNGRLVAKVKITSVQKDRSIANVIQGPSRLGEPMEGDIVIPAHPES